MNLVFQRFARLAVISACLGLSVTSWICSARNEDATRYLVHISVGQKIHTCIVNRVESETGSQRNWGKDVKRELYFTGWNGYEDGDIVTVSVEKIGSTAKSAVIRPESKRVGQLNAGLSENGRRVAFKLSSPAKVSVEFDDDSENLEPLLIFIDKKKNDDKSKHDPSTVYVFTDVASLSNLPPNKTIVNFPPGQHRVGFWKVPAQVKKIYIEESSVFVGYIYAKRENDNPLIIAGRGTISNKGFNYHFPSDADTSELESSLNWYKSIEIDGGSGNLIEGITIIDPSSYMIQMHASNSKISNVKLIGFRMNNDAITIGGSNNVINDCWIMVNDDAIVLSNVKGLSVKRSVFWQLDVGSVFQLGWSAHDISDLSIDLCDVIHAEWSYDKENSGFINLMAARGTSKAATLKNVSVKNIYVDTPIRKFINIKPERGKVINDPLLGRSAPWKFQDVIFSNIHLKSVEGFLGLMVEFSGYSGNYQSENVKFEDFYIDNQLVTEKNFFKHPLIKTKNIKNLELAVLVH